MNCLDILAKLLMAAIATRILYLFYQIATNKEL